MSRVAELVYAGVQAERRKQRQVLPEAMAVGTGDVGRQRNRSCGCESRRATS